MNDKCFHGWHEKKVTCLPLLILGGNELIVSFLWSFGTLRWATWRVPKNAHCGGVGTVLPYILPESLADLRFQIENYLVLWLLKQPKKRQALERTEVFGC